MTNLDSRLVYENAKAALRKAFPDVPNIDKICKLTQSTLRFEQPLKAGNTNYIFPVLNNENLFSNTEQRLLQQDSAVIYQMGLFVAKPSASDATNFPLYTYPSKAVFSTGTTAVDLQSLYNGFLSIAVNNDILVPNWDTYKHLNVPEKQATTIAPATDSSIDEVRGAFDGFYPVEPNIVLIGSKNNVIQLRVPGGIATVEANSRLVLIVRAILAQNSTVVS